MTNMTTDIQNNKTTTNYSDGSELIPAEVNPREQREGNEPPNQPLPKENAAGQQPEVKTTKGYTVDRMGLVNNYPTTPDMYAQKQQRVGFTEYAEMVNGRAAMIGFVSLLLLELITGEGFLSFISHL
jgi:hypothetical protein